MRERLFQRRPSIRASLIASHLSTALLSFAALFGLSLLLTLGNINELPQVDQAFGEQARILSLLLPQADNTIALPADELEVTLRRLVNQDSTTQVGATWSLTGVSTTARPSIQSALVVDSNGRILATSDTEYPRGTALAEIQPTEWQVPLERALAGVQDLSEGQLLVKSGDWTALVAYPILNAQGHPIGAVGLHSTPLLLTQTGAPWQSLLVSLLFVFGTWALSSTALAIPALLISILVSTVVSRRLAKRLQRLEQATAALAQGQTQERVPEQPADEIGRLASHFNAMTERLRATEMARRTFTLNVCHELRTPVAVMQARLETSGLLERNDPAIETIYHETTTLSRLIDDLFALVQLQEPQAQLEVATLDLHTTVEQALAGIRELAWNKQRVRMLSEIPQHLSVRADQVRLTQILRNLTLNALRYTPEGGVVRIAATPHGALVAITVQDTGVGIPAEELPNLFHPHHRRAADGRSRTGLGLAIVQQLVERQGGTIAVESAVGQGTTFTFTLPAGDGGTG